MMASRIVVEVIGFTLIFAPLVLWIMFYSAARWWSFDVNPGVPWVRALRWIAWVLGAAMFVIHLGRESFRVSYGIAGVTCSAGLGGVEQWMKRRFTAEQQPSTFL